MSREINFLIDPVFARSAKKFLSGEDLAAFKAFIGRYPTHGAVISGTGGFRKIRWSVGAKGKSGGVRIIYFYLTEDGRIILFDIYAKSAKDNLTHAEKNELKKIAARLKRAARSKK
jgi:mRNA-degrading endonuclease RelE of RelBE toxin-antitoxin system